MIGEDRPVGRATIGNDHQPICVPDPGSATIMVMGKVSKVVTKGSYMLELAVHNNLPSGMLCQL